MDSNTNCKAAETHTDSLITKLNTCLAEARDNARSLEDFKERLDGVKFDRLKKESDKPEQIPIGKLSVIGSALNNLSEINMSIRNTIEGLSRIA